MTNQESPKIKAKDYGLPVYFDLQAKMGHTKHLGGEAVTRALAERCRLGPGKYVLNVGSGAGISAAYLVQEFGCRMEGVDLLPGMVESARLWAKKKGLNDRLHFQRGDAQDLPFENDLFDAVLCESVNVFIPDKEKAMGEYVRVTKPGGSIGLTEAIWIKEPSPEVAEIIMEATGQLFLPSEVWENLLREAGLVDLVFEQHGLAMREEARNQFGLLSLGEYLRVVARAVGALALDRETRSLIKYMSSNPRQYFEYMGYGLYVGRVQG
jgi:ubiquinone/menaquinone biosynthesis C-methylase UbiE